MTVTVTNQTQRGGISTGLSAVLSGRLELQDTERRTLTGDITLATTDPMYQSIDPGGAARNVDLPAEANGLIYIIANRADAAETITVRDDADATIDTVAQNETGIFWSDGNGWSTMVSGAANT